MNKLFNVVGLLADGNAENVAKTAWDQFKSIFDIAMPILIAVVLVFGLVYSIILGVQFAKAEDTDQRDKAKQRLINVIIGVVVAAVLMAIIYAVLPSVLAGAFTQDLPDVSGSVSA